MDTIPSDMNPLSRFLEDDNTRILESLIPYCPSSFGRLLALEVKLMEIRNILHHFPDDPVLSACGLNENTDDLESTLRSLRNTVSPEKASQIDTVLQVLQFGRMYQQFSRFSKEHPELQNLLSSTGNTSSSGGNTSDFFSDPSLFLLLNSLTSGEDSTAEKLKKILEFSRSGGSTIRQ